MQLWKCLVVRCIRCDGRNLNVPGKQVLEYGTIWYCGR